MAVLPLEGWKPLAARRWQAAAKTLSFNIGNRLQAADVRLTTSNIPSAIGCPHHLVNQTMADNSPGIASNPLWYKDAIIYQVHVKSFFDSNADGYGDFPGLIEKLNYIQDLGVDCIWLLPFYPSPLRDDGYDIADYVNINPVYGDRNDFSNFMSEAHKRGIRVITELVINHTSDEHAWFQAARRAPAGSEKRNWYVWSDTDQKYKDARIIFCDTETSNWTWDPVAKAYYWHRFFHHQPDLNFDNPNVLKAVLRVMRFWLDMGVDGLRLDAIPYLIEREGTNCENLPETHAVLKQLRRALDEHFSERIFLAEANQWPTDVSQYFGDGDECHMAFHFPLMPRIFMALHQEDRHPITEILRQMPEIPDSCQWAIFLRNHDELTLEMVTDSERDYMYKAYAQDPQMRINLGIRRRLAPLLDYSRPRIELLNSLLFSLPGTPIVYYGDEIGMGENIFLGDRNGVRTPMQWSSDRNAGFSRALFAKLYSAPLMDPITGYQSINVEAQQLDPSSLLNWMRTIIKLRKSCKVFGRGKIDIIPCDNRKILCYLRSYQDEIVLVTANLSRYPQSGTVDLSAFKGVTPVEMFGLGTFHEITDEPYVVTLGPYGFYWLLLRVARQAIPVVSPQGTSSALLQPEKKDAPPRLVVKELAQGWPVLMSGVLRQKMEGQLMPRFLKRQKWLNGKARNIGSVRIKDWGLLPDSEAPTAILLVDVEFSSAAPEMYAIFFAMAEREQADRLMSKAPDSVLVELYDGRMKRCVIYDATDSDSFYRSLLSLMDKGGRLKAEHGEVAVHHSLKSDHLRIREGQLQLKRVQTETGPVTVYNQRFAVKLFRQPQEGINPDYEVGQFLAERGVFKNTPASLGWIEYKDNGELYTLALLQSSVPNQGDGWTYTVEEFRRFFERAATHDYLLSIVDPKLKRVLDLVGQDIPIEVYELLGIYLREAAVLGKRTAELHISLSGENGDEKFHFKPMSKKEVEALSQRLEQDAKETFAQVASEHEDWDEEAKKLAKELLDYTGRAQIAVAKLSSLGCQLIRARCHGDYKLQSVLYASGDFFISDFAGAERDGGRGSWRRTSTLADVAGMLVSLSDAAYASFYLFTHNRPDDYERFLPWARICQMWIAVSFLKGYLGAARGHGIVPDDAEGLRRILIPFALTTALLRISEEIIAQPEKLKVSLLSLLQFLRSEAFAIFERS
ncbi:MAG TPA: maltose alpha-D-glucosyltransferase [Candidatus Obscuribacterales bacterium]